MMYGTGNAIYSMYAGNSLKQKHASIPGYMYSKELWGDICIFCYDTKIFPVIFSLRFNTWFGSFHLQ